MACKHPLSVSESIHQLTAKRAYEIWENEGRPDGRHLDHWLKAEKEFSRATRRSASGTQKVKKNKS